MGAIQPVRLTLIEPIGVPEIFYSGIGAAHLIGSGIVEMLFYRDTPAVEFQGLEHRVVARVFRPTETIEGDAMMVLETIRGTRPPPFVVKLPQAG
jgi:hypothetical protein